MVSINNILNALSAISGHNTIVPPDNGKPKESTPASSPQVEHENKASQYPPEVQQALKSGIYIQKKLDDLSDGSGSDLESEGSDVESDVDEAVLSPQIVKEQAEEKVKVKAKDLVKTYDVAKAYVDFVDTSYDITKGVSVGALGFIASLFSTLKDIRKNGLINSSISAIKWTMGLNNYKDAANVFRKQELKSTSQEDIAKVVAIGVHKLVSDALKAHIQVPRNADKNQLRAAEEKQKKAEEISKAIEEMFSPTPQPKKFSEKVGEATAHVSTALSKKVVAFSYVAGSMANMIGSRPDIASLSFAVQNAAAGMNNLGMFVLKNSVKGAIGGISLAKDMAVGAYNNPGLAGAVTRLGVAGSVAGVLGYQAAKSYVAAAESDGMIKKVYNGAKCALFTGMTVTVPLVIFSVSRIPQE